MVPLHPRAALRTFITVHRAAFAASPTPGTMPSPASSTNAPLGVSCWGVAYGRALACNGRHLLGPDPRYAAGVILILALSSRISAQVSAAPTAIGQEAIRVCIWRFHPEWSW